MNHLAKLLIISLAACTATPQDTGLTVDVQDADRIAGTFTSDGVAVAFDFSRQGDRHVMAFHRTDGSALITTTLDGAFQTTNVLDGRLVASGISNAPDPTIVGDRAAMQELTALPEAGLLEGLHDALVAAGVDLDLYQPRPPEVSSVYDNGNGYFVFQPGETRNWASAAGAWPTYVYVKKSATGACAAVTLEPWNGWYSDYVVAGYSGSKAVYWWGAIFTVRNLSYASSWGPSNCQPAQVQVRVSPYTP